MAKYEFDDGNPKSIEEYAKQLLGKSFYDVIGWKIERDCNQVTAEQVDSYANKHRKGGLGNLLENVYFNYKSNSDPHADFVKAGVELKVTPKPYPLSRTFLREREKQQFLPEPLLLSFY